MPPRRSTAASRALLVCVVAAAALLGPLAGSPRGVLAADEPIARTEKWYEESQDGHKTGWRRVVWTPSTWKGTKTVHDTTTVVTRTTRNMAGMRDVFETTVTSDLERGEDGTYLWMRSRVEESGRVKLSEVVWTGSGYRYSEHIIGQEENRETFTVPLDEPVIVDSESLLGPRARKGELAKGDVFELRQLDLRGRKTHVTQITVLGEETLADESGKDLPTWKLREFDPASKSEMFLWLDHAGTFVRVRSGAFVIQRTTRAKAEQLPARPAEYSITVGASPRLERIFSADRVLVDVRVRPDEHRKLPEFPTSPWSRVLAVEDLGEDGHRIEAELRRYDDPEAKADAPVVDPTFERWLEATAQMQTQDKLIQKTVKEILGDEKDARTIARKLARFVYTKLAKRSLDVAQGDAVQILRECRGDCSEHCLLFVTLCRAAGVPARRCSGYVCIGSMWGSHAWAEIWTGAWIGADPTTGEVGTGARYLFFGYPDESESYPGVVSSRARGRMRILTTRVEEGGAAFDVADEGKHRIYDADGRRYLHVLAGLEARGVPDGWRVSLSGDDSMLLRGPEGAFSVQVRASADQGEDIESFARRFAGRRTTFAGAPALLRKNGTSRIYIVFSRRRIVQVFLVGASQEQLAEVEKILAPTFAVPALAWK